MRLGKEHLQSLAHRGPDAFGIWTGDQACFGHTRLAILDLSSMGAQPMADPSGRFVIVFNGEIYNFREIRAELEQCGVSFKSAGDTEVLLAAYAHWGVECVERLRGMFAFAVWDDREKALFMARDRCGEKPFFYWHDARRFFFASELKGLLPLLPETPALDPAAVDMYLHYQYTPEPFTLLDGVRKLPAAHWMRLDARSWRMEQKRYWTLSAASPRRGDAPALILEKLEEAVALTLRSDVPVGVALSGGIDSGALAALAMRHSQTPMHAFSVGYPGRPPYDERDEARELAERLGMVVHEVEIPVESFVESFPELTRLLDEPIADPAAFGHFAVPRKAAELGVKVILSGIGGDELFWGYAWTRERVELNQRLLREGLLGYAEASRDCFTPEDQLVFLGPVPDFQAAFSLKERYGGKGLARVSPRNAFAPTEGRAADPKDVPNAILRLLFDTWLVSNCLSLGDRVSMACGVETRMPFLDCGLIELVQGLRAVSPDHGLGHKAWLKAALKGVLPDEALARPKRGFQPPVWEWLSGVVSRYGPSLCRGRLHSEGIVNGDAVANALKSGEALQNPHVFFLYKLALLEQWSVTVARGRILCNSPSGS